MVAAVSTRRNSVVDPVAFRVTDVTRRRRLDMTGIDGHRTAGEVAASVASLMDLPTESRFSLRDDRHGRLFVDDDPLGQQIEDGVEGEYTLVPVHLGAGC